MRCASTRNASHSAGPAGSKVNSGGYDRSSFTVTSWGGGFRLTAYARPPGSSHPLHAVEVLFGMNDSVLRREPTATVGTLMPRELERLRSLSRLLDNAIAIPGTRYRIGLDAIVGVVPGIGDAIGAVFSMYIIFQAARMGVPKATLARMLGNVGIDTLVGEIPLLGDLFDVGFKSNIRNLALIEQHVDRPVAARAQSGRLLLGLGIGLIVLIVAVVALGVVIGNFVVNAIR